MATISTDGTQRKASKPKRLQASSIARSAESHRLAEVSRIPGAARREAAVRELIERAR